MNFYYRICGKFPKQQVVYYGLEILTSALFALERAYDTFCLAK